MLAKTAFPFPHPESAARVSQALQTWPQRSLISCAAEPLVRSPSPLMLSSPPLIEPSRFRPISGTNVPDLPSSLSFHSSNDAGLSVSSIRQLIGKPNIRFRVPSVRCNVNDDLGGIRGDRLYATSTVPLQDAKVLYCVAPSLGHNQESHPESNLRIPAIVNSLEKLELTSKYRASEVFQIQDFQPASVEDIARVHLQSYVYGLEKVMVKASEKGLVLVEESGPTYVTKTTFQDSLIAAGAGISLVDSVVAASKLSMNPPIGFSLARPPGHHAVPSGPMGFCVFGNVAIAARHAQRKHGLRRVLIFDFDVHHGNGTSDAFYDDPDVLFISTHQERSYPGTGKIEQVGKGRGEGTTINLPLPGGSGDSSMRHVFDEVVVPCAQRFKPDIILVSSGYDAHVLDDIAGFQFTTGTYYTLAANIKQLAKELCGGRCVFFLEGGYNLYSLSNSVADTFHAFLGEPSLATQFDDPNALYEEPLSKVKAAVRRVKAIHSL